MSDGKRNRYSNKRLSKDDLANISEASVAELVALYDGAQAAAHAWNGAHLQPRAGEGAVSQVMEDQYNRCFYLMKGVAKKLFERACEPTLEEHFDCARVLLDWYWTGGEDNPQMLRLARLLCQDKEAREAAWRPKAA